MNHDRKRLHAVKLVHTMAWAFLATCVLGIPLFAWARRFDLALVLTGIVTLEVFVLLANAWRCPLTAVAARYTEERQDNFDIYLPLWVARYNREIFGPLFLGGMLFTLVRWLGWLG